MKKNTRPKIKIIKAQDLKKEDLFQIINNWSPLCVCIYKVKEISKHCIFLDIVNQCDSYHQVKTTAVMLDRDVIVFK